MTKKCDLFLVDDDINDLELFSRALEQQDLNIAFKTARDGKEALDFLEELSDEDLPQLMVIDFKMPRMDGVQLLEELRVRTRLQTIPAVILTSSQDGQDIKRAYAAGANAYLVKPVSFTEFNQQVELLIKFWMEMNQTVSLL